MESKDISRPYLLINTIQNYPWGKQNESAFIARLLNIDPPRDEPFAELWMGTHPNGPSKLIDPDRGIIDLAEWIAENPVNRLSHDRSTQYSGKLPYMLKVLSAGQMLSIQTHPDKTQAEQLHAQDPTHYPDDNHKPELAIAIDSLDALVGFISDAEFKELLSTTPELGELLDQGSSLEVGVKRLLELWKDSPEILQSSIRSLCKRLNSQTEHSEGEALILEQSRIYGTEDMGLLFILLLNRVRLEAGQAVFLGPGIPHAYLKGNIIECMANSDNVVRLGLTGKFCDPAALTEVLNFDPDQKVQVRVETDGQMTHYPTPTDEFRVRSLALDEGEHFSFKDRSELTLFLVLQGEIKLHWCSDESTCCSIFNRGESFLTPANLSNYSVQARTDSLIYLVELPRAPRL